MYVLLKIKKESYWVKLKAFPTNVWRLNKWIRNWTTIVVDIANRQFVISLEQWKKTGERSDDAARHRVIQLRDQVVLTRQAVTCAQNTVTTASSRGLDEDGCAWHLMVIRHPAMGL